MKPPFLSPAALLIVFSAALSARPAASTTASAIAIANLDHQLAQTREPAPRIELLLVRARFLADYDALDEAVALAAALPDSGEDHLLRARMHAAVHRFDDAVAELDAAQQAGADARDIGAQRATIRIATGHAADTRASLEAEAAVHPGYASFSALANADAALGRYADADREYRHALAALHTTSPFPYAWIHFARGLMWSEQAGDRARGEAAYDEALTHLPEFVTANIHKAELEIGRGDFAAASARLGSITHEPEAIALLAEIAQRRGDLVEMRRLVDRAGRRYDVLLSRQPLAFADHAAEFHLGPGANPQTAWHWASLNLANRTTPRAFALAIDAAAASGHDVCALVQRMNAQTASTGAPAAANASMERSGMHRFAARCQ